MRGTGQDAPGDTGRAHQETRAGRTPATAALLGTSSRACGGSGAGTAWRGAGLPCCRVAPLRVRGNAMLAACLVGASFCFCLAPRGPQCRRFQLCTPLQGRHVCGGAQHISPMNKHKHKCQNVFPAPQGTIMFVEGPNKYSILNIVAEVEVRGSASRSRRCCSC